jgi:hypothetical protein
VSLAIEGAGAPAASGKSPARVAGAFEVAFYAAAAAVAGTWIYVLPCDATDLSYLISLQDRAWVPQELVHPLWVPLLWVLRGVLGVFGYHGQMLVPIEVANALLSLSTAVLVFRVAKRRTSDALAAACAALALIASAGFGSAAFRPTPYAPGFACVLGALLILSGERRAPRLHVLGAGALAGIAMALHASAMALAPAALLCFAFDPERTSWRDAIVRTIVFCAGLSAVFVACWAFWFRFNGLDKSFFDLAGIRSLFGAVEQVPGTSIYSSHSALGQLTGIAGTWRTQAPLLIVAGAVAVLVEGWAWRAGRATAGERRLLVAAAACFGGIAGFFAINNNKTGFNYAAFALVPLLFAQALARLLRTPPVAPAFSRIPRARLALVLLFVPPARHAMTDAREFGQNRFHERLPPEAAFVESALGPRGVLLTPGCAFGELRMLSSIPTFRVGMPGSGAMRDCADPSAEIGPTLRERVRAWQRLGGRVLFAYGDEAVDYYGDAYGMEKDYQLFWSPELSAGERAPRLQAARRAMGAAGMRISSEILSPRGERYGEVAVDDAQTMPDGAPPRAIPTPPSVAAVVVPPRGTNNLEWTAARQVERFHALVPGDPWASCDAFCTAGAVPADDQPETAAAVVQACGCSGVPLSSYVGPQASTCWFGPPDSDKVGAYIREWSVHAGLGAPSNWNVSVDRANADVTLTWAGKKLRVTWHLADTCEPKDLEVHAEDPHIAGKATADAMRAFATDLPATRRPR